MVKPASIRAIASLPSSKVVIKFDGTKGIAAHGDALRHVLVFR